MATAAPYPVRVDADLDPQLSRWLWLVKWFLAIPHYVVLSFLWAGFVLLTVFAFFAILVTGRYPRPIFDFNVGVLRWSWRVADYSFGVLATDRYPPFTLKQVEDYPAHLDIAYPDHLSRGLALIKWWLLAIPHYLIVGVLVGSGFAWTTDQGATTSVSLLTILVLIAAVTLAVTGRYPRPMFDLILGLNRWVLRVAAYAGLMTDTYPPFRLDMGGHEPESTAREASEEPQQHRSGGWTAGPIVAITAGALAVLLGLFIATVGAVGLWVDRAHRDAAGFINTGTQRFQTESYALRTEGFTSHNEGPGWRFELVVGQFRVQVTPEDAAEEIFVGIGRASDVDRYLDGVARATITDGVAPTYRTSVGGPPSSPPAEQRFWAEQRVGTGEQTLAWDVRDGSWTVVVMNADAAPGVDVRASAAAELPVLSLLAIALLVFGMAILAIGITLIVFAVRRAT